MFKKLDLIIRPQFFSCASSNSDGRRATDWLSD